MSALSFLVVDDEQDFLDSVKRLLKLEGYNQVFLCNDPSQALTLLEERTFDVAFLDITMPKMDGLTLLEHIKAASPQTECIIITAHESAPLVVKAIRRGAYDYLVKPLTPSLMNHALQRALERKHLLASLQLRSQESLDHPHAFSEIITGSPRMLRLLHEAELHASSDIPVLITGETGVGKELLAQGIHRASHRNHGPFVAVNLISIAPTLFESTFFGHTKGAFTGAEKPQQGLLAQAEGGTLFLDEIGDLSLELQGKLLRFLQEKEYIPVGETRARYADVRIIAATHQDLEQLVKQHRFRKDLLYRLQFAHLAIPPLRQRKEDILLLTKQILTASNRPSATLSLGAEQVLQMHQWPGNIRELKGTLEAAANLAEDGTITKEHLRLPTTSISQSPSVQEKQEDLLPLAEIERQHILRVYKALDGNKSQTARVLEIGLQTLHRKLKSYGIS
ncbi:MAG: sigma-54-dependent Fis family transcriptional regulator [Myxococcales bacterium]|nr:sigma-54-dependent Fis family transcriptional regulator [Myxococcales bacterium]MCB9641913.1 sigma-54-dependent Fis family transcriptional regulator [Myxococcales bacterium]